MAASPPNVRQRRSRVRGALLLLLLIASALAAGRWWQVSSHRRWLERASVEELASAAHHHLDDPDLFRQLGERARELEQWPRAAKAFQHACELAPDLPENWVGWARSVYELAGFQPADAILTHFISTHPGYARAYAERAALRRTARRTEMAWSDADKATQCEPNNGDAWALRGDLCLDQGIAGEAEKSYRKARSLMPKAAWPCVGLYQAFVAEKKMPEALEIARVMHDHFSAMPESNLYLGEALVENAKAEADYDAARAVLMEANKQLDRLRRMDQFTVAFLIGRTYFQQRNYGYALAYFETADRLAPENPDLLFLLGRTYRAVGDNARADATLRHQRQVYEKNAVLRQFNAKVNDRPDDASLRLALARQYLRNGDYQGAGVVYEEMISRGLGVAEARRKLRELGAKYGVQ